MSPCSSPSCFLDNAAGHLSSKTPVMPAGLPLLQHFSKCVSHVYCSFFAASVPRMAPTGLTKIWHYQVLLACPTIQTAYCCRGLTQPKECNQPLWLANPQLLPTNNSASHCTGQPPPDPESPSVSFIRIHFAPNSPLLALKACTCPTSISLLSMWKALFSLTGCQSHL